MVVSNDSDLLEPIKIVREQLGKKVGIPNPQKNPSRALLPHIDFIKQIRVGVLGASRYFYEALDHAPKEAARLLPRSGFPRNSPSAHNRSKPHRRFWPR